MASTATFRIWRGERGKGDFKNYETKIEEGMVVLDAVHQIQATQANDLVGIIRTAPELEEALERLEALKERARSMVVEGHRQYNPGWHLALDLPHMLVVSECIARAALEREESRGGHTRDDFPGPDQEWAKLNVICTSAGEGIALKRQPLPVMPDDLAKIFEETA